MKKVILILCAAFLLFLPAFALAQQTIPLVDLPAYHQWAETDIFSYEYAAADGSDETYRFIKRPDGRIALQYASPSHPSSHHQYPLDDNVIIRDDGYILLIFDESYNSGMKANGVLIFGGKEYRPTWLTTNEQAERAHCGNVLGSAVPAVAIDGGCYRIGNGHYGYNNHLYYVPQNEAPMLLAEDHHSPGFCVYEGWFYLTNGKTDAAGNYTAYQENSLFEYSDVYLLGMNKHHLYFCNSIDCAIFETDHNGGNARCIFDLGSNGVEIRFTSMSEDTICCSYIRDISYTESETSFALIDLNTYQHELMKPQPCRTTGDWSHTSSTYADWAGIYGDSILFYTSMPDNMMVRRLEPYTGQTTELLPEYELRIQDGSYISEPHFAKIGDWLYHAYYGDAKLLVRSKMDGSVISEFVASLSEPIEDVIFANNRLLLRIQGPQMTNQYIEIGY